MCIPIFPPYIFRFKKPFHHPHWDCRKKSKENYYFQSQWELFAFYLFLRNFFNNNLFFSPLELNWYSSQDLKVILLTRTIESLGFVSLLKYRTRYSYMLFSRNLFSTYFLYFPFAYNIPVRYFSILSLSCE